MLHKVTESLIHVFFHHLTHCRNSEIVVLEINYDLLLRSVCGCLWDINAVKKNFRRETLGINLCVLNSRCWNCQITMVKKSMFLLYTCEKIS